MAQNGGQRRCYLVCASPRTGSSLLCDTLWRTNLAGTPGEPFLPANIEKRGGWPPPDPKTYLHRVYEECSTPNGVGGAKVMWQHWDAMAARFYSSSLTRTQTLSKLVPDLKYIWISRRDKVRQAASIIRAVQTGAWQKTDEGPAAGRELGFHLRSLDDHVWAMRWFDWNWWRFFKALGIRPHRVIYEDFVAAFEPTMAGVLEYLGFPGQPIPAPRLKQQADDVSEEWIQRYRNRSVRDRVHVLAHQPRRLYRLLSHPPLPSAGARTSSDNR